MLSQSSITTRNDEAGHVVSVVGELDIHLAARLRALTPIESPLFSGTGTLDLSAMTFVDSVGLSALLGVKARAEMADRPLRLVPPPPEVSRTFEIAGIAGHLFGSDLVQR